MPIEALWRYRDGRAHEQRIMTAPALCGARGLVVRDAIDAATVRHFPVGPVVGGLTAGALIAAGAGAPRVYYEPVYARPGCYVRRERFWDGWASRYRRVEVC